ncbi:MAG: hypothetical protein KDH09_15005 [Chrysiogenetes bacterium]|nr:hypothetical protein [Chrysiogenetes bacterium]
MGGHIIDLVALSAGFSGFSQGVATNAAEAASVCLEAVGHANPCRFKVAGYVSKQVSVHRLDLDHSIRRAHADMQEATEDGATAIAIGAVREFTAHTGVERSYKGTGFDYWLGDESDTALFDRKGKLEISGTLRGDLAEIQKRVQQKKSQVKKGNIRNTPGWVVVVGFALQEAHMVEVP